jgi:enhancer of polycomb-like protein
MMSERGIRSRRIDIRTKLECFVASEEVDHPALNSRKYTFYDGNTEIQYKELSTTKTTSSVPIPDVVESKLYQQIYTASFTQPCSYIQEKQDGCETRKFCEYDLDDSDEDWLTNFNKDLKLIDDDTFERLLYELELLDFQVRSEEHKNSDENCTQTCLDLNLAQQKLQHVSKRRHEIKVVYDYWRAKRSHWKKPILRRLQPQTKASDTNYLHTFRPHNQVNLQGHACHGKRVPKKHKRIVVAPIKSSVKKPNSKDPRPTKKSRKVVDVKDSDPVFLYTP